MTATAITLEPATPTHLDGMHALYTQVGWVHRRDDLELLQSVSQGLVGVVDGRVIATVLMTPYGDHGAMISSVIVDTAMRGHGLGRRLMTEALALAGNRTCWLVATEDGLPLYEKLGFVVTGQVSQHQGAVRAVEFPDGVAWAGAEDHERLTALDHAAYGHDRSTLMHALRNCSKFAAIREAGDVQSFAAIREFGLGQVIGPVVARSDGEARKLIDFLLATNEGQFIRIDTNITTGLAPWLVARGLAHVGGGIVMVRAAAGGMPSASRQHWTYTLASQSLG